MLVLLNKEKNPKKYRTPKLAIGSAERQALESAGSCPLVPLGGTKTLASDMNRKERLGGPAAGAGQPTCT